MMMPSKKLLSMQAAQGFSLVELMVSITIGLILLLGLSTLLVNSSNSHREMQKSSAQIENGRYAMQMLSDDVQMAGYLGELSPTAFAMPNVAEPCVPTSSYTVPEVPVAVGYDPAADLACLADRKADTGVLVLRRALTTPVALAGTNPPDTSSYLQVSMCNNDPLTKPFVLGNVAGEFTVRQKDCATPSVARRYILRVYYIADGDILKMREFSGGALQPAVELVDGIEDMQFDYGVDVTGDGAPDQYKAVPAATELVDVMALRINLLARNLEETKAYSDSKTYNLGLNKPAYVPASAMAAYKRHAYSALVRIENASARREQP
jgi:type IV pilus assembly protein PilW